MSNGQKLPKYAILGRFELFWGPKIAGTKWIRTEMTFSHIDIVIFLKKKIFFFFFDLTILSGSVAHSGLNT